MSELFKEVSLEENKGRINIIKEILLALYHGQDVEALKRKYHKKISLVKVSELSRIEQVLMVEDGIPPGKVKRVCSNHIVFFKHVFGLVEDVFIPQYQIGHPVHTFFLENNAIETFIDTEINPLLDDFSNEHITQLLEKVIKLFEIDKHFERKEQLLFPYLERYGIYGPSTMMWELDDKIRNQLKTLRFDLASLEKQAVINSFKSLFIEIAQMIFREENMLIPACLKKLTEDDWINIYKEEKQIGYTLIESPEVWKTEKKDLIADPLKDGYIQLETGVLRVEQLELLMNHLPVDVTFIDENDVVRYFSHGKNRIFNRTKAVIGRSVQNCHPPQSVHIVEKLLEDFKIGRKDVEDFWIPFKDKFVLIRYFAVRDEYGTYKGTLEFTQDIASIKKLSGEKRLLS